MSLTPDAAPDHGSIERAVRLGLREFAPGRKTPAARASIRARLTELGVRDLDDETREAVGEPALRRGVAAVAEIDASLACELVLARSPGTASAIHESYDDDPRLVLGLPSVRFVPDTAWDAIALRELASVALGIARASLARAARYATDRIQFGRPIAELGAIRGKLARVEAEIRRLEASIDTLDASRLLVVAADTAVLAAHEALQIHGGIGYTLDAPIESFYRDALELAAWLHAIRAERLTEPREDPNR